MSLSSVSEVTQLVQRVEVGTGDAGAPRHPPQGLWCQLGQGQGHRSQSTGSMDLPDTFSILAPVTECTASFSTNL